ncbi:MAG: anaerobic sulfatase maturase [Spirochaetaceae bacterium]|nr:MAG: anaerobic sulfatase maturase [Spirochaetaceae bacterium]
MSAYSLLVKPSSADCNIHCSYCFYLEKAALYPGVRRHQMSARVLERTIAAYMATPQPVYSFGWQGGEPTLMGPGFFRSVTDLQQKYGRRGVRVSNGLQTNGILLNDEFARHFADYNFLVGISIDGPEEIHDRHRLTLSGRGTQRQVLRGLELLRKHGVQHNVLTLVSTANVQRAREVYRYLRDDLGISYHQYIPCVEFDQSGLPAPYTITAEQWGRFLLDLFDEWHGGDEDNVSIRHFDSVLTMLVDGYANSCVLSRNCRQYFVVEHNGDVYPCDFFVEDDKRLGNVMRDRLEDMWDSLAFREFGRNKRRWNAACTACPYRVLCAGDCQKMRHAAACGSDGTVGTGSEPSQLSWLCGGWKLFYGRTLPHFESIAETIRARQRHVRRSGCNSRENRSSAELPG